jgi:hypothetical protein
MRCAAITRAGERCKAEATHGSYCWNHAPEFADERKQRARRAGRSGGNGRPTGTSEVAQAKSWVKGLISKMLRGEVERDIAATAFMGVNTLARLIDLERRIQEQDEIVERIEALEAMEPERAAWRR